MEANNIFKKKDNITLYSFQGIACILVILIHAPFPGVVGIFFSSLARLAVPLFFMISGYTLYPYVGTMEYKGKVKDRLIRNAKMTSIALMVYFIVDILKNIIQRESILDFIQPIFQTDNLLKLILLGVIPPGTGGILWFMVAMVYVYTLRYVFPYKDKTIYLNAIASFIIMIVLNLLKIISTSNQWMIGSFSLSESWIYGNWISIGVPSFNIGIGVAKYIREHKHTRRFQSCYLVIILGCIIMNFHLAYVLDAKYGMYLSYTLWTLIMDVLIFLISYGDENRKENVFSVIGKLYSRDIYLWHPIIISLINISYAVMHVQNKCAFEFLKPFIVIGFSIPASVVIVYIRTKMRKKV